MEFIRPFIPDEDDYDVDEVCRDSYDNFRTTFPNLDIHDLKLLRSDDNTPEYMFTAGDALIGFRPEDCYWFQAVKLTLSVQRGLEGAHARSDEFKGLRMRKGSRPDISYELYPFEQCHEIDLDLLIPDINGEDWTEAIKMTYDSTVSIGRPNMYLRINSGSYAILEGDKVVSGFHDPATHFQFGDCATFLIFNTKTGDVVVQNCGDVASVVVIRFAAVAAATA